MHWLDKLWRVSEAETLNLRDLALLLDENPASFYRGQDLAACDLRGQDLRDMDLTGCNIEKALLDESTKLNAEFDMRTSHISEYIDVAITRSLNKLVLDFADEAGYKYPAWAFKALLEYGIRAFRRKRWIYYRDIVSSNRYFAELIDYRSKSSLLRRNMQIYTYQQKYITQNMEYGIEEKRFGVTILIGLLSIKIPYLENKDYSVLTPNSLIRRKMTGLVDQSNIE